VRRGGEGAREYVQCEKKGGGRKEVGMMATGKKGGKGKKGVEWGKSEMTPCTLLV